MKIGVTGSDIILNKSGGTVHVINVINELNNYYDVIFFPDPETIIRTPISTLRERIEEITTHGIKFVDKIYEIIEEKYNYKKIMDIYSNESVDFLFTFDYGYLLGFNNNFTVNLSKRMNKTFGITIMSYGDQSRELLKYLYTTKKLSKNIKIFAYRLITLFNDLIIFHNLCKNKRLSFIMIMNNNYKENIKLNYNNVKILYPSNGINNDNVDIKKFSGKAKENKIIFFARLHYMKGIFDIPPILSLILRDVDTKLVITGNFDKTFNEEKIFWRMVDNYSLRNRIVYKGFLSSEELFDEVASSKLLLYPSHGDSFSLSVAQALLLQTPVIAYDIAGLNIYKKFKSIKYVKEFDYEAMAKEAVHIIKADSTEDLFEDNLFNMFISEHTWYNVAMQYKYVFDKFEKIV